MCYRHVYAQIPCLLAETFIKNIFRQRSLFDCGWYLNMSIGDKRGKHSVYGPQGEMPVYGGSGVTLNCQVDNVDAVYKCLMEEGLSEAMLLEDHPGEIGASRLLTNWHPHTYISDREPSEEFRQFYMDE